MCGKDCVKTFIKLAQRGTVKLGEEKRFGAQQIELVLAGRLLSTYNAMVAIHDLSLVTHRPDHCDSLSSCEAEAECFHNTETVYSLFVITAPTKLNPSIAQENN